MNKLPAPTDDVMAFSFAASFMSWMDANMSENDVDAYINNLTYLLNQSELDGGVVDSDDIHQDITLLHHLISSLLWRKASLGSLSAFIKALDSYMDRLPEQCKPLAIEFSEILNDVTNYVLGLSEDLAS